MPAGVRDRVFGTAFATTKPRHRGLGLPTVFRALAAHGGGIRLATPPEGVGTLVQVVIPVATARRGRP